jgi:hypothetical protein
VPSPEAVVTGLTAIANNWRWLAIAWHVMLAALVVMLLAGWRPSIRLLGHLVVSPLLSVSVVAWLSGNPFNGAAFAILAAVLVTTMVRVTATARLASSAWVLPGTVLVAFGWTYPHFVTTESWTT